MEGFIQTGDGVRLYYRVIGDGQQTVIIPAASYLVDDVPTLANRRRLVFYDQRNRGRSDAVSPEQISLEHELRDIEAVRQHFALDQFALTGWSYLGAMAALYAAQYLAQVSRLLMVCAMSPYHPSHYADQWPALEAKEQARMDPQGIRQLEAMRAENAHVTDPERYCREHMRIYRPRQLANAASLSRIQTDPCGCANEAPDHVKENFEHLGRSFGEWDWRSQVATATVPTLVVHGGEDLIPLTASRDWAVSLPNARLFLIENSAHFPCAEAPEVFFPAVERFLSGDWPDRAEIVPAP